MAERKSRGILITLSVFLFLLVAGLSLFLVFYKIPRLESINYYFAQCDEYTQDGKYRLADDSLGKAASFTQSRNDWFGIIKRSYTLSTMSNEWDVFRKYSERAVKLYQGNEDFWAFYLSSLLWTGRYDEAAKYKDRLTSEKYSSIIAEIRLNMESLRIDEKLTPYDGVLESLEIERDASFFTLVGNITDLDEIKIDAVMLWMGLENKEKALEVIKTIHNPQKYLQIIGLVYWDCDMYEDSLALLALQNSRDIKNHNDRWTLNNILGDGYFLTGDWEKAEYHYLKSLEIKPDENWRPRVNRSLLYESVRIFKTASNIIFDTFQDYYDQREVVLYFLDNWQETYPIRSERVVSRYLMNHPDDVDILLEKFISFPDEMTPEKYHAFLWNLFNENSQSEKVSRYLMWYLIGLGDFKGVEIVMERHSREIGFTPEWFSLYKGIIYVLNRPVRLDLAEKEFRSYYDKSPDQYGAYNLAVVLEKMGNIDEAEKLRKVVTKQ